MKIKNKDKNERRKKIIIIEEKMNEKLLVYE